MTDKSSIESGRVRRAEPECTSDMEKWRDSIDRRDRVYAVSYRQAVDSGKSPEDARAIARDTFLRSFEVSPEVMFMVNLERNSYGG